MLYFIDLSHNKIGDTGVKRLCRLLEGQTVLTTLNLGDNVTKHGGILKRCQFILFVWLIGWLAGWLLGWLLGCFDLVGLVWFGFVW